MLGDEFLTVDGRKIEILEFGELNSNAGPDFLDAKIRLDGNTWAGAIEFHINASDWFKHKHQFDPAYGNVIAHFVLNHDANVSIKNFELPAVELKKLINSEHLQKYQRIVESRATILCHSQIETIAPTTINDALEARIKQRLWKKAIRIIQDIEECNGDRKLGLLIAVARIFGGKVNSLPFENLIKSIQLSWFGKLNYDDFKIEALILGTAGILPSESNDPYVQKLINEFHYLKRLLNITENPVISWKYSRMRPTNFPDIRLAQFGAFMNQFLNTPFDLEGNWSVKKFYELFSIELSAFWASHYRLENQSKRKLKIKLSKSMLDLILINALVPYIYAIGIWEGEDEYTERAMHLLRKIKPEKNSILNDWSQLGVKASSAFESQGLIELKNEGCNRKKCLFCAIGKAILKV